MNQVIFVFILMTQFLLNSLNPTCPKQQQYIRLKMPVDTADLKPSSTKLVYQSNDGGQNWVDVSEGIPSGNNYYKLFSNEDKIYLVSGRKLYSSNESPVKWELDPFMPERFVYCFPGNSGIYTSDYGGSLFHNIPGLGFWLPIDNKLDDQLFRQVLETKDGRMIATSHRSILISDDHGKNWREVFQANNMTCLVNSSDKLFVAGEIPGVLKSTDGGEHWQYILEEENVATKIRKLNHGLAVIMHDNSGKRFDQNKKFAKILFSTDQGINWVNIAEGLPQARVIFDIAEAGQLLFCATDSGVYRSSDQGHSWNLVRPYKGQGWIEIGTLGQSLFVMEMNGGC